MAKLIHGENPNREKRWERCGNWVKELPDVMMLRSLLGIWVTSCASKLI